MYDYLIPVDDGLRLRPSGAWAAEKLDYLQRYIETFETSMRERWQERNYIDLLAGPGKIVIRGKQEIFLGSPLLALTAHYPFTGYYFIDSDPQKNASLQTRCSASPLAGKIRIWTGDCNLLVDRVIQELKPRQSASLNLGFLDPEGMELHWETVRKLASLRRMDLIINYPEGGLNRIMAKVFQSETSNAVDIFFGTQEWRLIYNRYQLKQLRGLHRELIDLYKSRLVDLGYQEVKLGDQVGGDEPLMRNTRRNAPLYRLIFASKNPLGDKFWHAITQRNRYGQMNLFDAG
jgi:three-Cys-motif partner protein